MNILLVEDDSGIITPLKLYLEWANFQVSVCMDGSLAYDTFKNEKPQLVILDLNLPWKNGVDICREIRANSKTPIIILSARESEDDKVTLLEIGADDYVAKPFSPRELVARIHAVIKRTESLQPKEPKNSKIITYNGLTLDSKNHICTLDESEIKLTKTEFSILEYLLKNAKWVVKREALMKDIIGYDNYIYDRTIDTHIKNLRRKVASAIDIETIRGVGYRIYEAGSKKEEE